MPSRLQPCAYRFELFRRCFFVRVEMIQAIHHQGVRIGKNPLVDGKPLTGLIDALIHGDGLFRCFADSVLEIDEREMEQLQRSIYALQKVRFGVGVGFVRRPRDSADFGDRRKPVFEPANVAVGFPRITPGPIDAEAATSSCVLSRHVELVIGSSRERFGIHNRVTLENQRYCIWSRASPNACRSLSAFFMSSVVAYGYSEYSIKLGRW